MSQKAQPLCGFADESRRYEHRKRAQMCLAATFSLRQTDVWDGVQTETCRTMTVGDVSGNARYDCLLAVIFVSSSLRARGSQKDRRIGARALYTKAHLPRTGRHGCALSCYAISLVLRSWPISRMHGLLGKESSHPSNVFTLSGSSTRDDLPSDHFFRTIGYCCR